MNKVKALSNAVLMSVLMSTSVVWGTTAFAADNLQEYSLDTMVVTATRTEKKLVDTPANAMVITKEQIKDQGYSSAFELVTSMTQAGAMGWQDDGTDYSGMLSRIRLRGMDNGTLVLVNGHPSNFLNASALNQIPLDQIEKIEVVKGAGSVLYGPQAMAGVINVITKKPSKGQQTSGKVFGSMGNRYNDYGLNVDSEIISIGGQKSFYKDFPDIRRPAQGGGGALEVADKNLEQLFGTVRITDDLTASLSHKKSHNRWLSGTFKNGVKSITKDCDSDATYNTYSLNYDNADNGWSAGLSYMDISMIQTYRYGAANSLYKGHNWDLDVHKKINFNNGNDTLVLGGQATKEYWKSVLVSSNTDTDSERKSYSLYQSYDHKFSDAYNMIFGIREYWMGSSKFLSSERKILPQVQGLYKINDTSSVYFNVGKSFEMPQLSSNFYTGPKYAVNPDIKPQSSWSYETGYKYDNNKTFFSASIFYVDATDKIIWGKTTDNKSIQINADKWKNYGLELNLKQKVNDKQDVYMGATFQNPKSKSDYGDWKTKPGEWSQDESKVLFNLGTTYHQSKLVFDTRITATLKREPSSYLYNGASASAKTGKEPDHNLKNRIDWSASLSYNPTDKDTLRLVGRNLLNRKDVVNYNEYYCTPINFYVTYERRF